MFKNIYLVFVIFIFFSYFLFFGALKTVSAGCCACNLSTDQYGNCNVGDGGCSYLCPTPTPTPTPTPIPVNGSCSATHYNCSAGISANNVSGATTWTWNCNGLYGGSNAPCSQYKPPTCSISASPASIAYNDTSTITWSSAGTTGCTVSSPGWTGTSGSQSTGHLLSTTAYNLSCPGLDGTICTNQATVLVGAPATPTLTCTAYTNPASIIWDWTTSSGPLSYWLQVWGDVWKANGWYGGPTVTTSATPGIPYSGRVLAGDGSQSSNWSVTKSCTVPLPSAPALSCGGFNQAGAYTPVTATWANGTSLQVTRDFAPGTNPPTADWLYNAAASSPKTVTPPAGKYMPPGHIIYARTTYDSSTFSTTSSITCPVPADPAPANISGNLEQKSGSGCYTASTPSHTFNMGAISSTTSNNCVASTCTPLPSANQATTYNCAITFDGAACLNQNPPIWLTSATVNLTGASGAIGYTFVGWTDPPGDCQTAPNNSISAAAGSSTTKNLTLNFSGDKWLKTKDTSFNASSTTAVAIPMFASAFPASGDTGSPYFIIGQAGSSLGVVVAPGTAAYSIPNWHDNSYFHAAPVMNATNFVSYIKSRKSYQSISDLANINADGIYVWTGGVLTISDLTKFNQFNVVLISSREIIVDKEPFSPTKSLAIIASKITFNNNIHKANGIFIADTIDTGNPVNQGLQIVGNLIALNTLTNNRSWSDTSTPSIFVEFSPSLYITLFPYLSTASYQWNQIQ